MIYYIIEIKCIATSDNPGFAKDTVKIYGYGIDEKLVYGPVKSYDFYTIDRYLIKTYGYKSLRTAKLGLNHHIKACQDENSWGYWTTEAYIREIEII